MLDMYFILAFFFFQAEDGIRYSSVTGVQTCALPLAFFRCGLRLNTGRDLAEIFCQSSDGFPAARFVLDTIEPGKNPGVGIRAADSSAEACEGTHRTRCRAFALMGAGAFHAVGHSR